MKKLISCVRPGVFEARAKPGCGEALVKKLASASIDVVRSHPGNQSHLIGKLVSKEDDVVVFISAWKDLQAIKARFGEDWQVSYLPAGYADLIEDCSVRHIALESDWHAYR